MTSPFVLFALPRSRTFWTSRFLSAASKHVSHDWLVECDSFGDFFSNLDHPDVLGTVETGAVQGWNALRTLRPDLRFGILHRPIEQVLASLRALGTPFDELELRQRYAQLGALATTGVPVWQSEGLSDPVHAKSLVTWAGGEWDGDWFNSFRNTNLQINWPGRVQRLAERRPVLEWLKAEALGIELALPPVIAEEGWNTLAAEAIPLGRAHFEEVNAGLPGRKYALDQVLMQRLSDLGALRILAARRGGHLVGYSMWNIGPDVECVGQLEARQGPWYCGPQAGHGTGRKLFVESLSLLRRLGIDVCYPHHHLAGRSSKIGKFYRSFGAVPATQSYQLWLKDTSHG